MKILVLYGSKPSSNSQELVDCAIKLGHTVFDGSTSDVSSEVSQSGSRFWLGREDVTNADLCLLRSFGPGSCEQLTRRISLIEHMELAGIRVVNPTYPFRRARDKYSTQYVLQSAGLPVAFTVTTESLAKAYRASQDMGEFIYKPILSSMGRGAIKFEDADLAYNIYKTLSRHEQPMILQQYIPNPGRDIRVFVIGEEIAGSVYKYLPEGKWKSNVAQGGRMVDEPMDPDILELSLKAVKAMKLDYCGVDIIEGPKGPVILEMNASPGWQGLKKATGKKIAEQIINYSVSLVE
jgi:ribosomal protein S6--L-glutamate ligase